MKIKMRTKIFNVLLALSVALSAALATAPASKAEVYSGYCGDNLRWSFDESTGKLNITGTGKMDYIYSTEEFAVYDSSIKTIYIGSGVTDVEGMQCWCMDNLTQIIVDPNNDYYCSDSDGVLYDKHKTKLLYFPQKSELQFYDVPYGVDTIGEFAFYDCDNLICITLPGSVKTIEGKSFSSLNSATTAPHGIEIPLSVEKIADDAFEYASNIHIYYIGTEADWDEIGIFHHYTFDESDTLYLNGITMHYDKYMPVDDMIKAVNDELNPPPFENTSMTLGGLITIELLCSAVLFAIGYSIVKKYKESNAK